MKLKANLICILFIHYSDEAITSLFSLESSLHTFHQSDTDNDVIKCEENENLYCCHPPISFSCCIYLTFLPSPSSSYICPSFSYTHKAINFTSQKSFQIIEGKREKGKNKQSVGKHKGEICSEQITIKIEKEFNFPFTLQFMEFYDRNSKEFIKKLR